MEAGARLVQSTCSVHIISGEKKMWWQKKSGIELLIAVACANRMPKVNKSGEHFPNHGMETGSHNTLSTRDAPPTPGISMCNSSK